jgi:hypothetical protein
MVEFFMPPEDFVHVGGIITTLCLPAQDNSRNAFMKAIDKYDQGEITCYLQTRLWTYLSLRCYLL